MIPVCRPETVRRADQVGIDSLGIPGTVLMDTAARGAAEVIAQRADGSICVVAGVGNNGGDGWAVARWLSVWGHEVCVFPLGKPKTADAQTFAAICRELEIREVIDLPDASLYVDAIFGTGLARDVTGRVAAVISALAGRRVVSLDIPSGLYAATGQVLGVAVQAEATVTFGAWKRGLVGTERVGEVHLVDLGLPPALTDGDGGMWAAGDVAARWPWRTRSDHKSSAGHLQVVAGSAEMAGAAILTCRGAIAAGVGLVSLSFPAGALARLAALPPEVMVLPYEQTPELLSKASAVVAGPGLKPCDAVGEWLADLWANAPVPVLFDASALPYASPTNRKDRVVTPHHGEAARMLDIGVPDVLADRFGAASRLPGVGLLKGPGTLVHSAGRIDTIDSGSPALATGGSGDVLTGVIGRLLASGLSASNAAIMGAWVHGRAGENLASEGLPRSSSEIPCAISHVIRVLHKGRSFP